MSAKKVEVNLNEIEKVEVILPNQKEILMEKFDRGEEVYLKGVSLE